MPKYNNSEHLSSVSDKDLCEALDEICVEKGYDLICKAIVCWSPIVGRLNSWMLRRRT